MAGASRAAIDDLGVNSAGFCSGTVCHDAFDNLKRVTDPLSHYTTYDYDGLDRLKQSVLYNGADTDYSYDNLGNLASVTDPTNNTTSYTSAYLGRRRSEQTSYGTESYQYDLAGQLISKEDRLDQLTRYDFDKLGRVYQERWKDSGGTTIRTMPFTSTTPTATARPVLSTPTPAAP